jgi:hypothetical protein
MKRLLLMVPSWGRHGDLRGHSGWLGGWARVSRHLPRRPTAIGGNLMEICQALGVGLAVGLVAAALTFFLLAG